MLTAEEVYTELIRLNPDEMRPGVHGTADFGIADRTYRVEWQIRPNSVWRFGRVFLTCPECRRLATRVYLPASTFG